MLSKEAQRLEDAEKALDKQQHRWAIYREFIDEEASKHPECDKVRRMVELAEELDNL